jgi:hypothetical protein
MVDVAEDVPPLVIEPDVLERKRMEFVFPADADSRFSPNVLNGYVFDHMFTDDEKRAYLKTRPESLPFASRLYVDDEYIVLGKDVFEPKEPPIGEARTEYTAWNNVLLKKFMDGRNVPFASLKNGKLTISKLTAEGKRKLEPGSKKYEPVVCDTGENKTEIMNVFAKLIDSKGVGLPMIPASNPAKPSKILSGPGRCIYIELLAREEHNCLWFTPEELSVLYDGKASKGNPPTNQDRFTAEFKK